MKLKQKKKDPALNDSALNEQGLKDQPNMDHDFDVLIIGAGPSGLSAAQELAEKNLKVCVLESSPFIGGKPISFMGYPFKIPENFTEENLAGLKAEPQQNPIDLLPIEHGFRVYPENYNNLISIMKRIPTENGGNVSDNFTNELCLPDYVIDLPKNKKLRDKLLAKIEAMIFGLAVYIPYIVCPNRSLNFDEISIEELFHLENRSPEMRELILCLTDSLSSGMLSEVSSLAVMNILMNYYYAPGRTGFRTFNCPTHIAWLKPWENYLKKLGVIVHLNTKVTHFNLKVIDDERHDIQVNEVVAECDGIKKTFKAKYVIAAVPVDALLKIISQNFEMLRYDPRLFDLYKIATLPATGVQLYYEKPIKGIEKKLFAGSAVTHPWGVSYVDQASYWKNAELYAKKYGVISIYVSVTNKVGRYIKKTFQKCNEHEIAFEMFTEVENELKKRGISIPKRIGFFAHCYHAKSCLNKTDNANLDYHFNGTHQEDLLHLCIKGMHKWRPLPETTYLGNLHLCGAYTKNNTYYVSTMESASESGRRAASAILKEKGFDSLHIYQVQVPQHISRWRSFDKLLYNLRIPNPLDIMLRLLRKIKTNHIHMDASIRSYEDLHW